nr:hypothetical protein [uncultured Duganella sp.]
MSTRKKNADLPRRGKAKSNTQDEAPGGRAPIGQTPPAKRLDLAAMLMVGDEAVVVNAEDDDNVDFMAEFIDPV